MSLIITTLVATAVSHSINVDHRGKAVEAIYTAQADIRQRTIGAHTPNRTDMRRCQWTAHLIVERRLAGTSALARSISRGRELSGSQPGPCSRNTRAVEHEVSHRQNTIRDHVVAIAQQDRTPLLTELDSAHALASN